jgi:AcrR family transcriptional regulator
MEQVGEPPSEAGPGQLDVGQAARRRIFEAGMQLIAEYGLQNTRMRDIAQRAGMSAANVLYHFKSKDDLLVQALRWSETSAAERRREELATLETATERLVRFVELNAPTGRADPELAIWLELWIRAPHDETATEVERELDSLWEDDLADIVALGIRRGEFAGVDPDEFSRRFCSLLDGLAVRVVIGRPTYTREHMIDLVLRAAARELGFRPEAARRG